MSRNISEKTLRFLYGKSGNKCAFPGCNEPIFELNGMLTGECCHIEAFSPGGARYNASTSAKEKNIENNLILLCARHHKIIDADPEKFTVECLKEMKKQHESQFSKETRELNDMMLFALKKSMEYFWGSLEDINNHDVTEHKIQIDTNRNIEELLCEIEDIICRIDKVLDSLRESDSNIADDINKFLEQLRIDYTKFDIDSLMDKLCRRNWEEHNLALPNLLNLLKIYYLELSVKFLETITSYDPSYRVLLEKYKNILRDFHLQNYYSD